MNIKLQSSRAKCRFSDLVGIDFSTTATKVVRLKKNKDAFSLMGLDLLPAVDFGATPQKLEFSRNNTTQYGCLAYSGASAVVRMVNAPLTGDETVLPDSKLRELLNVKDDYRVSAILTKKGKGRQDSSFLVAAIPEDDVSFLLNMFSSGPPAAASVEVAGLAFISAFLNARGAECANDAVCLIEAGELVSHFAFLNRGALVLVGKFDTGGKSLRSKVVEDLGMDDELAATILADHSINISTTMIDVMAPFLKKLSMSKDFVERHQGCRVSKIYISGGVSLFPHWPALVENVLHAEMIPWSPFENIQDESGLLTADLAGQATRFSVAIGAAIGGLELS